MQLYRKGANAERELIKALFDRKFSVVRAAGSGVSSMESPDVIAMRNGRVFAFECKAWNSSNLSIEKPKFESALEWCNNGGAQFHVAWKVQNKGWYFLRPELFSASPKFYSISRNNALKRGESLNTVLGIQTRIPKRLANAQAIEAVE